MRLTLKNAVVVATVAIIARLSSYFYFNSIATPTIEEFTNKVVETIAAIVLPVGIAFYVSKNKSETYQRNAVLILFVLLVAYVSNSIMQDRKNKEEITQLINSANLTLDGKEIRRPEKSENLTVNAVNEFVSFTNEIQRPLWNNGEKIGTLMPLALTEEMYTNKEALELARKNAAEIDALAREQIRLADEIVKKQLTYLRELEEKYAVSLDTVREGVTLGAARNASIVAPSMETIIEMMKVMKQLYDLIERNYGTMKLDANGIDFLNPAQADEYNNLLLKLIELDEKLITYDAEAQKAMEQARDQINLQR
jgi:hypothetical protein